MQIRREESVDELTREFAKERDITSAINLSRSLDETSWLGEKNYMITNESRDKAESMDGLLQTDPLSIPSPVRFIDKLQHNRSLTPSPIGIPISPKQITYRRNSLSPSNLRPSLLTSKRKLDPDDPDSIPCSPAKRTSLFYSPNSTLSSTSSISSPECISDNSSNQFSCDDDSGSDHSYTPSSSVMTVISSLSHTNPLTCDTRSPQSFAFVKPRYVAPQSPLAAGASSASIAPENNRKILGCTSYTFAPVKD